MAKAALAVETPITLPTYVLKPEEVVVSYPEGWDAQLSTFTNLLAQVGRIRKKATYLVACEAYYILSKLLKMLDTKREESKAYYSRMCSRIDATFAAVSDPLKERREVLCASLNDYATENPEDAKNDWVKVGDAWQLEVYALGKVPEDFFKPREIDMAKVKAEVDSGRKVPGIKATRVKKVSSR